MKNLFISVMFIISLIGCAEVSLFQSVVSEDAKRKTWADQLESMREKYSAYIGKSKNVLLNELGKPTHIREDVLKSGEKYDFEWSYVDSKGVPLLTETHKVIRFYINNDIVQAIKVF